jgi:hypothetical protein
VSTLTVKDAHPAWAADLILNEGLPHVMKHGHWQGETALLHSDGHEIPVSQVLMLHHDAHGQLAGQAATVEARHKPNGLRETQGTSLSPQPVSAPNTPANLESQQRLAC